MNRYKMIGRQKGSQNKKTLQRKENYTLLDFITRYKLWIETKEKIQARIAITIFPLIILSLFNPPIALFNIIAICIAYYWAEFI